MYKPDLVVVFGDSPQSANDGGALLGDNIPIVVDLGLYLLMG